MEPVKDAKNTNVDELLAQTELGSFIAQNKRAVIAGVVLLILGVIGYGFYSTYQSKVTESSASVAYKFSDQFFTKLQKKNVTTSNYVGELEKMAQKLSYHEVLTSLLIKSFDELHKQGDLAATNKVLSILEKHYLHKNSYIDYSIYVRKSVALEDSKDYKGAINSLNQIIALPVKIMEGKTYLDLGRLYIKVGNKEKAKSSLRYVIDNFSGEEFAKLAHIYLAQIK